MEKKKRKRSRQFSFVVTEEEYGEIRNFFASSACKSINDYARSVALHRPVVIRNRNESAERFLLAMLPLKDQLEACALQFAEAFARLRTLDDQPSIRAWVDDPKHDPALLLEHMETLRQLMNQYYIQCTQLSI